MKTLRHIFLLIVCSATTLLVSAQQVNTLFFLENAPMRHTINPALQPVSDGYLMFPVIGYSAFQFGNNSLTMSDLLYQDPLNKQNTITALHPNGSSERLLRAFRSTTLVGGQFQTNLFSLGFRVKEKGYVNINFMEHFDAGVGLPKTMFSFLLGGGVQDLTGKMNRFDLTNFGISATAYSELGIGYSHRINDQWTVGGKFKLLLGQAYLGLNPSDLNIYANPDSIRIAGHGTMRAAAIPVVNMAALPDQFDSESLSNFDTGNLLRQDAKWSDFLKPAGYGGAIDLGFTYKPHQQVQISAAVNDLGFIYWNNTRAYTVEMDTVFDGIGEIEYGHYVVDGQFSADSLGNDVIRNLQRIGEAARMAPMNASGFARMINARFNVAVDANFCNNKIGLGLLGQGRLYNGRFYGEVTLGGALRPCNWFNLALTYSLVENGRYSNIGAGLSLMPYDGINLTLAADYIPTSYAGLPIEKDGQEKLLYVLPYKAKGFNLAFGLSIVWGTNHKRDSDKDGVLDKWDMCPNTPRHVRVDKMGCPLDTDGDGVPDYIDQCPGTPVEAYGLIDSVGCPLDTDGDGVADHLDRCPNTPVEAFGRIDAFGCPLDSDDDGVPDYLDECPDTPIEAIGMLDEKGCARDSDGDGVPDYLDRCADTPEAAYGQVDHYGCPLDYDRDGVPDYLDECPRTPEAAAGFVDAHGCELDTDGDEVPDYKDECPTVPGPKLNKGCPEIKREVRNLLKKAMQGIQFETDKATIKPASFPLMDQIAQTFIENSNYIIEVQGHTDNVGNAAYNKDLSDRRAKAVREYLIKKGVEPERLTANGYGMERPIADNKTAQGRAENRRVEFIITFEEVFIETIYDHADPAELIQQEEGNSEAK